MILSDWNERRSPDPSPESAAGGGCIWIEWLKLQVLCTLLGLLVLMLCCLCWFGRC